MMQRTITMPSLYPVACHTDRIGVGSTFVAIKGMKDDGINHIQAALEKGAATIVIEDSAHISDKLQQLIAAQGAQLERVSNARAALAQLSAHALGYPAQKLRIIGVTGTKGKTTSAFLLEHVFKTAGYKTALLSTVHNKIIDATVPTNLTTQHPDYLHNFFALCIEQAIDVVVMEVAAQATSLHRVDGIEFDGLLFTNFAQEHGEFYQSIDEYFAAKEAIITQLKPDAPLLLNGDDQRVAALAQRFKHALLFGIHAVSSNYHAQILNNELSALQLKIYSAARNEHRMSCSSLVGEYNAYNIVGVVSLCLELGIASEHIAHAVETFGYVPGRLERYQLPNGASCFIDYAHNPSSYQAVLSMVRTMTSRLIVVFGCGGERDRTKRPLMGHIASTIADMVVITSDNPRSENINDISNDILAGIDPEHRTRVLCEFDREQAIKIAYAHSQAGSVIMLLGKGPDEYQLIGTQKFPFSEKAIVASL